MNILVLTTIYPAPDLRIANNTNVVHYFTKEWIKNGHNVIVVHNYPIYWKIFHSIAKFAETIIASRFNTSVTSVYQSRESEFEMDGVRIVRMPLFKPFPRFRVPPKSLNRQIEKIVSYCKQYNFTPEVITSHNYYPHMPMVNQLKEKYYQKARTCVVVHKQVWKMLKYCGKNYQKEIEKVDIWGYRSLPLKREFEKNTGVVPLNYFMCYSGIPIHFLCKQETCNITHPINRFIYVGSFIRRKYPEKVLEGILRSSIAKEFKLDYVGDGSNRVLIEKIIAKKELEDNVKIHGFVKREEVPNYIAKSQCFIMISEEETFGLVYLEAMSMGCITIASRNEGMEGIIEDGVNGFLCKAGDEIELAKIINRINTMSNDELTIISNNARQTAFKLTDEKVATDYINHII